MFKGLNHKVLILKGGSQYGVLRDFADAVGSGMEQLGMHIDVYDSCVMETHQEEMLFYQLQEYDFILSFNGMLLGMQDEIISNPNTLFWSFLVDHPYHHHLRLLSKCNNHYVSCIDRKHVEYVKQYYPNIKNCGFMPHGGNVPDYELRPFEERSYDVVFVGSYGNCDEYVKQLDGLPEWIREIAENIVNDFLSGYEGTIEDLLKEYLEKQEIILTKAVFRDLLSKIAFVDHYIRLKNRERVMDVLLDNCISIHVFGSGWEKYHNRQSRYLHIHGEVDYKQVQSIMCDTKIILNILPLFCEGSHERVFTSMLCGAVCVSECNQYLKEEFVHEEDICFYSRNQVERLPELMNQLLQNLPMAQQIAARGKEKVLLKHTWDHRAEQIVSQAWAMRSKQQHENYIMGISYEDRRFNDVVNYIYFTDEELLVNKLVANYEALRLTAPDYHTLIKKEHNRRGKWSQEDEDGTSFFTKRVQALHTYLGEYVWLYNCLEDVTSKRVLFELVNSYFTLSILELNATADKRFEQYIDKDILHFEEGAVLVDIASRKERVIEELFLETGMRYQSVYGFFLEDSLSSDDCMVSKMGFYQQCADVHIQSCGEEKFSQLVLDDCIKEPISILKLDAVGKEEEILAGCRYHIENDHPQIVVALDWKFDNIWRIANTIANMDEQYRFYLRYYGEHIVPERYVLYAV